MLGDSSGMRGGSSGGCLGDSFGMLGGSSGGLLGSTSRSSGGFLGMSSSVSDAFEHLFHVWALEELFSGVDGITHMLSGFECSLELTHGFLGPR